MRSPSELPLLRILHIKTLSAARSMLHSINYGTLSSCGSNGMGYCILKEKMATTTKSWTGRAWKKNPGYTQDTPRILLGYSQDTLCCHRGLAGTDSAGTSPGSAKQHTRAVHPPKSSSGVQDGGGTGRAGREWGLWSCPGVRWVSSDCVSSSAPRPSPSWGKPGRPTLPPGHEHHHKVLIWERGQAMQTRSPSAHGAGDSREGGQQQAKGHTPPNPQGHRIQHPPEQGLVMPLPQGRQQGFLDPKHQGQPWEFCYSAIYFQAQARFASKTSP